MAINMILKQIALLEVWLVSTHGYRKLSLIGLIVGGVIVFNCFVFLCFVFSPLSLLDAGRLFSSYGRGRGFIDKSFVADDGTVHRYIVFVPYNMKSNERLPLILYLNGRGKNGSDGLAPLIDGIAPAIWERTHNFPFVVVWPQCPENGSWVSDGRSAKMALAVTDRTADEYHTDPDRLYLSGLSSGGSGAWRIAADNPERFAAVVPISGGADQQTIEKIAAARLPIWMFSVVEDAAVNANLRDNYQRLLLAGLSPRHSELQGVKDARMDLHDAWSFAYRNCAIYRWLLAQNRKNRNEEWPSYELLKSTEYPTRLSSSAISKESPSQSAGTDMAVGSNHPPFTPCSQSIACSELSELHCEFMSAPDAERFSIGFLGPVGSDLLAGSTIELSLDGVSSGGLRSWPTGEWIQSSAPEAEHAFFAGRWNELRLTLDREQVSAELNGWPLITAERLSLPVASSQVGFAVTGKSGASVEIRNLRVRRAGPTKRANVEANDKRENQTGTCQNAVLGELSLRDIGQVAQAWSRREKLFPEVEILWTNVNADSIVASTFRSTVKGAGGHSNPEISQLVLSSASMCYSAPWINSRLDFRRMAGISGKTSQTDFLAALNSRFSIRTKPESGNLRLSTRIDQERRVDEICDTDGHGYLGVIFDKPKPWRDRIGDLEDLFWCGPVLAFRPSSHYGIGCSWEHTQLLSTVAYLGRVQCVIVEECTNYDNSLFVRRFWTDPQRDFIILKMTTVKDGLLREQVDVNYALNATDQWLPVSWTAVSRPIPANSASYRYFPDNDKLFEVASAKVTKCKVNKRSNKIRSTTEFQRDAFVFDQKNNDWFQQVEPGRRRQVSDSEATAFALGGNLAGNSNHPDPRLVIGLVAFTAVWILIRHYWRRG